MGPKGFAASNPVAPGDGRVCLIHIHTACQIGGNQQ